MNKIAYDDTSMTKQCISFIVINNHNNNKKIEYIAQLIELNETKLYYVVLNDATKQKFALKKFQFDKKKNILMKKILLSLNCSH